MAIIRIDPNEMVATASALRSVAVETAQLGRPLPSGCCPTSAESLINQLLAAAGRILTNVSSQIGQEANGLTQRGAQAGSGSLATAGAAAGVGAVGVAGLYSSMTLGGGGSGFSPVGGVAATPPSVTIGGGAPGVSGPYPSSNLGMPQGTYNAAGGGNAPLSAPIITNFQKSVDNPAISPFAESRSDVERRTGRSLSLSDFASLKTGGSSGALVGPGKISVFR